MAPIDYITVINSYVSQEGVNGVYTNFVNYSLLVTYKNGTKEIIEVSSRQINAYASYIRTSDDSVRDLERAFKTFESNISTMVDERVNHIVEAMFPIPDVTGMNEDDAVKAILDAGLTPRPINDYPEQYKMRSKIISYKRQENNFKAVDLRNSIDIPNLEGMDEREAVRELELYGFNVTVAYKNVVGIPTGKILNIRRNNDDLSLTLEVSIETQNVTGMSADEAEAKLKISGCSIIRKAVFSSTIPEGYVLNWRDTGDNTIILSVSKGTGLYKTKMSRVRISDNNNFYGDSFTANAVIDIKKKELKVDFYYTNNANIKRILEDVKWKGRTLDVVSDSSSRLPKLLDPEKQTHFSFVCSEYECIKHMNLVLNTSYGVIKKYEEINVAIEFDWEEIERSSEEKEREIKEIDKREREDKIFQLKNAGRIETKDRLKGFLEEAVKLSRFSEIKELWEGLSINDPDYSEIIGKRIEEKVYVEKMYGGTTPQKIEALITELKKLI